MDTKDLHSGQQQQKKKYRGGDRLGTRQVVELSLFLHFLFLFFALSLPGITRASACRESPIENGNLGPPEKVRLVHNCANLPFLSVMGVDGGVLLDLELLVDEADDDGGGNRLTAGRNSLLILTTSAGDGGVTGGGLKRPSPPSGSKTLDPAPFFGETGSSYSSLRAAPTTDETATLLPDDDDDEADAPELCCGGVGGVDDESKKLRLKSDVVSKLTSVVT